MFASKTLDREAFISSENLNSLTAKITKKKRERLRDGMIASDEMHEFSIKRVNF